MTSVTSVVKLASLITKVLKWPVMTGSPLPRWVLGTYPQTPRLVILGDAAHYMLPYMSQGAAMAVEDGAALAVALNHITSPASPLLYLSQTSPISSHSSDTPSSSSSTSSKPEKLQRSQLSRVLEVWEITRMQRTYGMQEASLLQGIVWNYEDGPKQRARDRGMRGDVEGNRGSWSSNPWSDPVTQWWSYGFDAEEAMQDALEDAGLAL